MFRFTVWLTITVFTLNTIPSLPVLLNVLFMPSEARAEEVLAEATDSEPPPDSSGDLQASSDANQGEQEPQSGLGESGASFRGEANLSIPIAFPSCRQIKAKFALSYSSLRAMGRAGFGWEFIVPHLVSKNHKLSLTSAQIESAIDFITQEETHELSIYKICKKEILCHYEDYDDFRPFVFKKTEGIVHEQFSPPSWDWAGGCRGRMTWRDPAGAYYEFGSETSSRRSNGGLKVYERYVDSITYPSGEALRFKYRDKQQLPKQKKHNVYLDEIRYYDGYSSSPAHRMNFDFEPRSLNAERLEELGLSNPNKIAMRLKKISVYTGSDLVWVYDFVYGAGTDLLSSVVMTDSQGKELHRYDMEWDGSRVTSITNGQGLKISYDYRAIIDLSEHETLTNGYAVAAKKVTDLVSSRSLQTTYRYLNPVNDAYNKLLGFRAVKEIFPDGSYSVTAFEEPLGFLQGKVSAQYGVDSRGQLVSSIINTWKVKEGEIGAGVRIGEVFLEREIRKAHEGTAFNWEQPDDSDFFSHTETQHEKLEDSSSGVPTYTFISRVFRSDAPSEELRREEVKTWYGNGIWRDTRNSLFFKDQGTGGYQKLTEQLFGYDSRGYQVSEELWNDQGASVKTAKEYDSKGNLIRVTDDTNRYTTYEYSNSGDLKQEVLAQGDSRAIIKKILKYDEPSGKPTLVEDENGTRFSSEYDSSGRLVKSFAFKRARGYEGKRKYAHADGFSGVEYVNFQMASNLNGHNIPSHTKVYHSGNQNDLKTPKSLQKVEYFDGMGRTIQTTTRAPSGFIVTRVFYDDPMGRKSHSCGPFISTTADFAASCPGDCPSTRWTYDEQGRLATQEIELGQGKQAITMHSYDKYLTTVTDADGKTVVTQKDVAEHVRRVIDQTPDGDLETRYEYTATGKLRKITDSAGNETVIGYNSLGQRTSMTDSLGSFTYAYDLDGSITEETGPGGRQVTHSYDFRKRPLTKTISMPGKEPVTVSWTYDTAINGKGRLASTSRGNIIDYVLAYDQVGKTVKTKREYKDLQKSYSFKSSYDSVGRLASQTYPNGKALKYAYHGTTSLVESVTDSTGKQYASFPEYGVAGLLRADYGNGTTTGYTHDPVSLRLKSYMTTTAAGTPVQSRSYTYSPAGRIQSLSDQVKNKTYSYDYDSLQRLVRETEGSSINSYAYDEIGNITSKTEQGKTLVYSYNTPGRPHQLSAIELRGKNHAYSYDDLGNMISGPDFTDPANIGIRTITYGADGMPVNISSTRGNQSVLATYDGSGQRARKDVDGEITLYMGDYEVKITPSGEAATLHVVAGGMRVASLTGSKVLYFHQDHLKSTSVLTDKDGNTIESTSYVPFGQFRDAQNQPKLVNTEFGFTGQRYDAETGLYYYNARYYDPAIGRFIMADTVIPDAGDAQSLNPYSYCLNNPLELTDPSGHSAAEALGMDSPSIRWNHSRNNKIAIGITVGIVVVSVIVSAIITAATANPGPLAGASGLLSGVATTAIQASGTAITNSVCAGMSGANVAKRFGVDIATCLGASFLGFFAGLRAGNQLLKSTIGETYGIRAVGALMGGGIMASAYASEALLGVPRVVSNIVGSFAMGFSTGIDRAAIIYIGGGHDVAPPQTARAYYFQDRDRSVRFGWSGRVFQRVRSQVEGYWTYVYVSSNEGKRLGFYPATWYPPLYNNGAVVDTQMIQFYSISPNGNRIFWKTLRGGLLSY